MRRAPVFKKDIFKFALTCAVVVGSMSFAANSVLAVEINDGTDSTNGIRNSSYYVSNNILDIRPTSDNKITVWGDIIGDSIAGVTNFVINGNGSMIESQSTNGNLNYAYQITNGSEFTINKLSFNDFGKSDSTALFQSGSLYGGVLYVMDTDSSLTLNDVSFSDSKLSSSVDIGGSINIYGSAIANNGKVEMTGGSITGGKSTAESGLISASGVAHGGAVYNTGSMSFNGTNISDNKAIAQTTRVNRNTSAYGGAIYNSGTLVLTDSTIENNSVSITGQGGDSALGGGIYTTNNITLAGGNTFKGNSDGRGANDIYFESGKLLVNGSGSDVVNTISSGLASANGNSSIQISNNGKLLLNGDNRNFSGNATVDGEGSSLTFGGNLEQSKLGLTTVSNGGAVEFDTSNNDGYELNTSEITGQGKFIKSGAGNLVLKGDHYDFIGDVIVENGVLNFDSNDATYINASSNQIADNAVLNYTNSSNSVLNNISGNGLLNKGGQGALTVSGDNSGFSGTADITEGTLIFDGTSGNKFFANDSKVNLNANSLNYTAQSSENLTNTAFSDIILSNGANFNYTATSGTTNISNDFYTSDDSARLLFNGNSNSIFVLNNDLTNLNSVVFNDANLFLNGVNHLTGNIIFNNSTLNLMDSGVKKDYIFDNFTANNSSLSIDVSLGQNPDSDMLTFNSGNGVLDISSLAIIDDNGAETEKRVQVIQNLGNSEVSILAEGLDPKIAAWSTNVYEYNIEASKSNDLNSYYDSLTFDPQQAASPDSLKKMNNYQEAQTRGFSLVANSPEYHISKDLEQTEYGNFTVNGVSKADSIISGERVNYTVNDDGDIIVSEPTGEYGSFFELTDTKGATNLKIHDLTIKDAYRASQNIKGGSILFSNVDNASITIMNAAFKDSYSLGNGGAFDIEKALSVNINGSDFSNIKSDALGGAIYSAVDLNITNSNFSGNTDVAGANDITLTNGADIFFTVDKVDVESQLADGIKTDNSSSSVFTKSGVGTLNISGKNSEYLGSVNIAQGRMVFDTATKNDSFFGRSENSEITIAKGATLDINNNFDAALSGGHFSGNGALNFNTDNFTLYGNNTFNGVAVLNKTDLTYIAENDGDAIFGGEVQFLNGATLSTVADAIAHSYTGGNFKSNNNAAIFNKNDNGIFTLIGNNSNFTGKVNLNSGTTNFVKDNTNTSFFAGDVTIGSILNYTANIDDVLTQSIDGNGILNKEGSSSLTLENSVFGGTANINDGTLTVISKTEDAENLDFEANIAGDATLIYTAGVGSSITLGGIDNKLNFLTGAQNATANITAGSIVLDNIANASGNNIILNDANITLSQQKYTGNYRLNNSTLNLMADETTTGNRINDYTFDGFSSYGSSMQIDVSLGNTQGSDRLVINNGQGIVDISSFAIIDDNGTGGNKTVQVIQNNGSSVSLAVGQDTHMADWSTNVYEYKISASQSSDVLDSDIYDSILFEALKAATPDSLRTMNTERSGVRGFSVATNDIYYIGRDLDETLAGKFTVNGKNKDTSIISGKRAQGYTGSDSNNSGTNGSFFEVINNTDLTISNLTIQEASRQNQNIKDGSVLYLENNTANVAINSVNLTSNSAAGNGGAIASIAGGLTISDSYLSGNIAGKQGGAVYAENEISIVNSIFSSNKDSSGANDIYVANTGVVNFNGNGTSVISSGIAGNGVINKNDSGSLDFSGNNINFDGTLNVNSGSVNFAPVSESDTYISGVTNISETANVNIENKDFDTNIEGTFKGNGRLFINAGADKSVIVNGDNSAFTGALSITSGNLIVNMDSEFDKYFGSSSNLVNDNAKLTFNVASGIEQELISETAVSFVGGGVFEKSGDGTLTITGNWENLSGGTVISDGILEYVSSADLYSSMISGDVNISNGATFQIDNQSGKDFILSNKLIGDTGSNFVIDGEDDSLVILNGDNAGFGGVTTISRGDLSFTKNDNNSFVGGSVNIDNTNSTLIYSTDTDGEVIKSLSGIGTIEKQGTGELTVNMDDFSGLANVNAGTLTVNADEQNEDSDGKFGFNANVAANSTLNYNAGVNDTYNINSDSTFIFNSVDSGATINFSNGNYNLSADLENAAGNTTGFSDAVINIIGDDVSLVGNYNFKDSTLNLADGNITKTTIENLTTSDTILDLDFDFAADNGNGAFDKFIAKSGNAQVILTDDSIKPLNMENDRGAWVTNSYDVLDGITFANADYSGILESNLYKYTVSITDGDKITLTASDYAEDTLYTLNHIIDDYRTFNFVGSSNEYYIGRALDVTRNGTLNIIGRTQNRTDTIIAKNKESGTGLSMFDVINEDTTLNINNVTIKSAASDKGGSVIYQIGYNSNVNITNSTLQDNSTTLNGGALYVADGNMKLDNVTLSSNVAQQNGGALYANGGNIELENVQFNHNEAAKGGALYNGSFSQNLTLDKVKFSNNTATDGSAIYNLGSVTVTDAVFENNSSNYIYNAEGATLTITSVGNYDLLNNSNAGDSIITNNGTLYLNSAANYNLTLKDQITGEGGRVLTNGNVIFDNIVSNSTVNVMSGNLVLNGTDALSNALDNVVLNINTNNVVLNNKGLNSGRVSVAEGGELNITNGGDIAISSELAGNGLITKNGTGKVTLSGHRNDEFSGNININNGTVSFEKTNENLFIDSTAVVTSNGANSKFEYTNSTSDTFDGNFAKVVLDNGGTVSISGGGSATTHNLSDGWLTSNGNIANNIIFNSANYILNTRYNRENINDNIIFNSSNLTLGFNNTPDIDSNPSDYDLKGNNYTFNNSVLDLSNKIAGDNYNFDELDFTGSSGLALDINLYLEKNDDGSIKVAPYADTITANSGSGLVDITKLFITDDNGMFIDVSDEHGNHQSKGIIQIFKGNNQLRVADADNVQILSWATNVYKYGVQSASSGAPDGHEQDSIEILPKGSSSTDTLRDLNLYEGNRGFSFIAKDGKQEFNNYNIYRDLDSTKAGTFSVLGTLVGTEKSILSGELKNLELLASENTENLIDNGDGTWTYNHQKFDSKWITPTLIDGEQGYIIDIRAFTDANQTNGSMFEIVNNTNFEMSNVSVQNAKRYDNEDSSIQNGSVIYAKNQDAIIKLDNVDLINNEVLAGNGGAIANILSNEFTIDKTVINRNSASAYGGAIYNESEGFTILHATVDGNSAGGLGGAIYTSADMQITDSDFGTKQLNTHNGGQGNDIYIANAANVEFVTSDGNTSYIRSGIAGVEGTTFTKSGIGVLELSGSNSDFKGTLDIGAGSVQYRADDNDTFVSGAVKINDDAKLIMDIAQSENLPQQILQNVSAGQNGSGSIVKNGSGILTLRGDNSDFAGETIINEGSVVYEAISSDDSYLGGSTSLASDTSLTFDISSNAGEQIASNISGTDDSVVLKSGAGNLILTGDNSGFNGQANVHNGSLTYQVSSSDDNYFSGSTFIASDATLIANVANLDKEGNEILDKTIGNITGGLSASFVKNGSGRIQLIGNNNFTGTTTIEDGILAYTSDDGSYVSGDTVIKKNGILEYTVDTEDDLTDISGNGTLAKLGKGNLNLVGDNSKFKGSVSLLDGRLSYNSSGIDNKFITAGSYSIAQGAELYINNSNSDTVTVSNLNAYTESGFDFGSGDVIKEGKGTLNLIGDNSGFKGNLAINSGNVTFTKDDNTSYISGNTNIASGAVLNYNTDINDTLENVSGSGILNKGGDKELTFNANNNTGVDSLFTANANKGTLNIIGASQESFDFNMIANNDAILNYTAAIGSKNISIGTDSVVKFGDSASGAQIKFNNGNYTLGGDIENYQDNEISFINSNLKLSEDTYKANYTIKDSVIDLINSASEKITFDNLTTTGSTIKIDVDLTLPKPSSDLLVAEGGNGGALKLALNEIKLNDKADNGLGSKYEVKVLGGNLTLDNSETLDYWTTSAYKYSVSIAQGDKNIILTAIKASDNNSLKEMNIQQGNRGFQFHADDEDPYRIKESLGTTASGSFIVTGETNNPADTRISGEDSKSFFEVTKDTDLTVKNVTIEDAHSDKGGSVIVVNNGSANVLFDNTKITSSSSDDNGGVINNNNSESFTINNSLLNNNSSKGLGGAIYTKDNMTIIDTDFSGNSDKNGKNDIYVSGSETVVNINAANKDVSISSGIAGNGIVNKAGNNTLNISGKNDDFTGNLVITQGDMNYNQSSVNDTYIQGNTNIGKNNTVTITNNYSDITTGSFSGSGTLNKNGSNDMTITGDNSKFTGTANINSGSVIYNANNTKYISGTTNINQNGTLVVNADNNALLSKINGTGTLDKNGSGALVFSGKNGFQGNLNVNEGTFAMSAGSSVGHLANAQFASSTGINLQNTSVVNLGNNNFTTNPSPASIENLYFNKLTLLGDVDLDIDVDLKNEIADKVGAGTVYGNGRLILDQDSLNVVSDSLLNNSSVQVAYGDLANHVALDQGVTTVMGPIQKYDVSYNNGNLLFARQGGSTPDIGSVNPAVMASPVATQLGGYLTQLQTLNAGFYHMDRYTKYPYMMRLTAENSRRYAINDIPSYRKGNLPETSNAMWIQPYTTFEQVNLRGGIGVSNVAYGAMYGGDSNLVDLGHGFKGVLSTFVGYNGSHMSFDGVSMNQQGGALGVTGTLYKGNFFTGLTVSAGASAGEAYTRYGQDHFAMLTAGVASKTGYNWEMKDGKFIVQPSLFLGYTFANTFDYTNAAGVRIDSDPLHAITIVPGVKFIANMKNGWQPYLGVNMVWSIMDKTDVMAQDVRLPQLSVKPYVEYGVGVQKTWGERFTAFFQTMIRNGGRTGVVLTAGFRWALGKEPNYDSQKVQVPSQKKVIKSL